MQFMKNTYTITDINSVPTLVVLLEIGEFGMNSSKKES